MYRLPGGNGTLDSLRRNREHTYIVWHAGREPIQTITGKGPVGRDAPYALLDAQ